jgi:tetraacyldisaccharide 4'-kinase
MEDATRGGMLNELKWKTIGILGSGIIRLWFSSLRLREIGLENLEKGRGDSWKPVVMAFLHGRLLGNCWNNRGQGACVMVSRHKDGEIITRINRHLGYTAARGSSTRGALSAMKGILRARNENRDLAFTVDGPRGPSGVVKDGVVYASSRTGCPVIPVAAGYGSCWKLGSWDSFQIPKPFSTIAVVYGQPLQVPRDTDKEIIESWRKKIEQALTEVASAADIAARPINSVDSAAAGGLAENFLTRGRNRWYHYPLLTVLIPLEWMYHLCWHIREKLFSSGRIRTLESPVPALCVGSLFAGGSGKSPLTMTVAARLAARGLRVAVLSRGYGGRESGGEPIVIRPGSASGDKLRVIALQAGDEPAMIAHALPEVSVVVCANRAAGAETAYRHCGAEVLVLDDGFGHRRLERDLDILAFAGRQLSAPARTFPAGFLREPVQAVSRAGAIAVLGGTLTRYDHPGAPPELPQWIAGKPVIRLERTVRGAAPLTDWLNCNPDTMPIKDLRTLLKGRHVLAFCGLANPDSFRDMLALATPDTLEVDAWPDHHRYSATEQQELRRKADSMGALLVTTEKDAVKLDPELVGAQTLVLCLALRESSPPVLDSLLDKLTAARAVTLDSRDS